MSAATTERRRRRFGFGGAAAMRVRFLGVLVFLVLLIIAFSIASPKFFSFDNGRSILFSAAILAIAAVGQTIVVLTGNLDLSVGSIMGVTAYVVFDLAGTAPALQPWVVLLAVAFGVVLGGFNGFLVSVLGIPSIVATLGTLSIYRGFVSFYASGSEVTVGQLPDWMRRLATAIWLGIPANVWISVAIVLVVGIGLRLLPWGRMVYAYGSNPKAAQVLRSEQHGHRLRRIRRERRDRRARRTAARRASRHHQLPARERHRIAGACRCRHRRGEHLGRFGKRVRRCRRRRRAGDDQQRTRAACRWRSSTA